MNFFNAMETKLNDRKSITTNGATAYETSGKKLLDFNFGISAMRNMDHGAIYDKFMEVFLEDKKTAIEYLFYIGDIRGGLGERKVFRAGLQYLIDNNSEIAKAVAKIIPYYNRWDSVLLMLDDKKTRDKAVKIIRSQIKEDIANMKKGKPVSLCAKWLPSSNASSKITRKRANILCEELELLPTIYRQTLSKLRKYIDVTETKMSSNRWSEINYESVPSKANLIYSNAFMKHDGERRREYLESLKHGDVKINASTLNPHEICTKYRINRCKEDPTLEALWEALPNLTVDNVLVVRDGSGSMIWTPGIVNSSPLDVATALAIYMSEHNTGEWKDKYITFSSQPKIVNLSNCDSLAEKVRYSLYESDCSNTDIYRTMRLILDTAIDNDIAQEDMPKMVVICSDMQFDGRCHNLNQTLFDRIKREFEASGYKLPRICFWNLDGRLSNTIPMQQNDLGLILCSGFSVQILKMFMSNQTDPYKVLLETLHSERYDKVRKAIDGLI